MKKGFSLMELMIAVLIIGVISGISLDYLGNFEKKQKFEQDIDKFIHALKLAKYKAILERERVDLVFNGDVVFWEHGGQKEVLIRLPNTEITANIRIYFTKHGSRPATITIKSGSFSKELKLSFHSNVRIAN